MVQHQKRNKPLVDRYISNWFESNKAELDKNIRRVVNTKYSKETIESNPFLKFFTASSEKPIETLIKMQDGYDVQEKYYTHSEQYYKLIDVCYCGSCGERGFYEPTLLNVNNENDKIYVTSSLEMSYYEEILEEDVILFEYIVDLGRDQYLSHNGNVVYRPNGSGVIPKFKYSELRDLDERWLCFANLK